MFSKKWRVSTIIFNCAAIKIKKKNVVAYTYPLLPIIAETTKEIKKKPYLLNAQTRPKKALSPVFDRSKISSGKVVYSGRNKKRTSKPLNISACRIFNTNTVDKRSLGKNVSRKYNRIPLYNMLLTRVNIRYLKIILLWFCWIKKKVCFFIIGILK